MSFEAPILLVHTYAPHSEKDVQADSDNFVEAQARATRILWNSRRISGIYVAGGRFAVDKPTTLAERYAAGIKAEIPSLNEDQLILHHQAYSTGGELRAYWRHCLESHQAVTADLAFLGHGNIRTIIERRAPREFRQWTELWTTEMVLYDLSSTSADHRLEARLRASSEYQHLKEYLVKRSQQYAYPFMDLVFDTAAAILGPRKFALEGKSS